MKLDTTDIQILKALQNDGRESASHIAKKVNVSVPTVTERIRKLQESGIILGFQTVIDPTSIGLDVVSIVLVKPSFATTTQINDSTFSASSSRFK